MFNTYNHTCTHINSPSHQRVANTHLNSICSLPVGSHVCHGDSLSTYSPTHSFIHSSICAAVSMAIAACWLPLWLAVALFVVSNRQMAQRVAASVVSGLLFPRIVCTARSQAIHEELQCRLILAIHVSLLLSFIAF